MKLERFIKQVQEKSGESLREIGVYDNQVVLLHSPNQEILALAGDLERKGYRLKVDSEFADPWISLDKDGCGFGFSSDKYPIKKTLATGLGYSSDRRDSAHSDFQLKRFNRYARLRLNYIQATKSEAEKLEEIKKHILDFLPILAERNTPFCIPHSLPEPVYFPDVSDDEVRELVGGEA